MLTDIRAEACAQPREKRKRKARYSFNFFKEKNQTLLQMESKMVKKICFISRLPECFFQDLTVEKYNNALNNR